VETTGGCGVWKSSDITDPNWIGKRPECRHWIKLLLFWEGLQGAGGWCPVAFCPEP